MRPAVLLACALAAAFAADPARADFRINYGLLTCDGDRALIRIAAAPDTAAPVFPDPPPEIDLGLSEKTPVDGDNCTLADGREVRVKIGEEQPRPYVWCGGAGDAFASLWVGGRKVLSRKHVTDTCGWKDHRDVILLSGRALTLCRSRGSILFGDAAEASEFDCEDATGQLIAAHHDPVEYPPAWAAIPALGTMTFPLAEDPDFCTRFVTPNSEGGGHAFSAASLPDAYHDPARMRPSPTPAAAAGDPPFAVEGFRLPTLTDAQPHFEDLVGETRSPARPANWSMARFDFDNDGDDQTVLIHAYRSGGFDGDVFLVPDASAEDEITAAISAARAADDTIGVMSVLDLVSRFSLAEYSGRFDAMTPDYFARYTYQQVFRAEGQTYVFATPARRHLRPTAVIYRPRPGGEAQPVCVFQRVEENF